MNRAKFICKILFYITFLLGLLYLLTVLYSSACLITGWGTNIYGEGKYLHILYPFTQTPFLNVDNNTAYKLFSYLLPLSFYALFFLQASQVFKAFTKPKLFAIPNLGQLKRYYWLNLLLPLVGTVVASFFVEVEGSIAILIGVHFILGIFAFLLAEIFRQGLKLQNEQDLYI